MKKKLLYKRQTSKFVIAQLLGLVLAGLIVAGPGVGLNQAEADGVPSALNAETDLPPIPNLDKFIKDNKAAIRLGKALFWDMQAGSDGQACASCHFHAGADNRVRNQLSPGLNAGDDQFDPTASGAAGGPDYTLVLEDFPFHQKVDDLDRSLDPSNVKFNTNDVASSQGVFNANFLGVISGNLKDDCQAIADAIFHVGGQNTRRVEPRHTPSVYMAALNFENFWDGRAKNNFNGVDPLGFRTDAKVWRNNGSLNAVELKGDLELINSSLASQAVGPPLSNFEMSCAGRIFPHIGKKLIPVQPLHFQKVHPNDSVLGNYIDNSDGKGLNTTYMAMIQQAFHDEWWNSTDTVEIDGIYFSHKEANFSLFWGLAIQAYERTLIPDQTPFDHFQNGDDSALTDQQKRGFGVFLGQGKCVNCHATAAFTKASTLHLIGENQEEGLVERMLMGDQDRGPALYDNGFYNIAVTPTMDDIGRGAEIPDGQPLSFTRQYIKQLLGKNVPDPFQIDECKFEIRFDVGNAPGFPELQLDSNGVVTVASGDAGDLPPKDGVTDPFPTGFQFDTISCDDGSTTLRPTLPAQAVDPKLQRETIRNLRTAVDGSFKVPTVRLVELTGPFFHNGGNASLWQVVSFYNRGGDFFEVNQVDVDPDIRPLGLTYGQRVDLVAFMKSLTDPRVVDEKDIYDHPQLFISNGGTNQHDLVHCVDNDPYTSCDAIEIPAVGKYGRTAQGLSKLQPFQKSPTSGNLDGAGGVDFADAQVLFSAFGKCRDDAGFNEDADYDTDNCITFADYQIWYAIYQNP